MPIDPNIAMGVRPVEQPNMLAQMGQMMAIRQAQQGYESENAVKDFYAQGGDLSTAEGRRKLMAQTGSSGAKLIGAQSEINARDVKTGMDSLKMLKDNVAVVNTPADMAIYLQNAAKTPGGQMLFGVVPLDKALANIPNDPKAFDAYKRNFGLTADRLYESADAQLSSKTSLATTGMTTAATMRGQDMLDRRAREQLHSIETGQGPGVYQQFGPNAGVIRPMTQAPWSPPPGAVTPSAVPPAAPTYGGGGGPLGSGTFGMAPTGPNTLRTAPPVNMMLQGAQPPAGAVKGLTQATPKGPSAITTVNAFTPASETAQAEFMKGSRATFDQLKQAPTVLENIEKAKALVPTAKGFMGTGGETMLEAAKFMNNRLGTSIDTAGIKSAEELNSRLFMGIMDNLKKMDAQPSQQQQAAMKQALGNLGTDPSAMNAVLDVFGDIVRGKVDIHNAEVTGAEARGIKFPYNPVIKLPERAASVATPVYATNGKDRIMSTDGGKTWNPVGAK
jgi:hypothetical protein